MKNTFLGLILFITATSMVTLSNVALAAEACGLNGTVKQRIEDCRSSSTVASQSQNNEFQLVSRTLEGHEVYKGQRTGVIWSTDLGQKAINYLNADVATICSKTHNEFAGIEGHWILPSVHRYLQASKYDIQNSLPKTKNRVYWTATSHDFYVNSRYVFEGDKTYTPDRNGNYTFRFLEVDIATAYVKCIIEPVF